MLSTIKSGFIRKVDKSPKSDCAKRDKGLLKIKMINLQRL